MWRFFALTVRVEMSVYLLTYLLIKICCSHSTCYKQQCHVCFIVHSISPLCKIQLTYYQLHPSIPFETSNATLVFQMHFHDFKHVTCSIPITRLRGLYVQSWNVLELEWNKYRQLTANGFVRCQKDSWTECQDAPIFHHISMSYHSS